MNYSKLFAVYTLAFIMIGLQFQSFGMEAPDNDRPARRTTAPSTLEQSRELKAEEFLRRRIVYEKGKEKLLDEEIIVRVYCETIEDLEKAAQERERSLLNRIESLEKELQAKEVEESRRLEQAQRAGEAEESMKLQEERLAQETRLAIPLAARGHEEVYRQFLKGVLVYRPKQGSEEGRINLPIASLLNPLESTFDLSQCGNRGKYLSISTGYRKGMKQENKDKLEIWFTPRFLVEKEIEGSAKHLKPIFPNKWPEHAQVGIFWTWGGWTSDTFYYSTNERIDDVSKNDLYEKWRTLSRDVGMHLTPQWFGLSHDMPCSRECVVGSNYIFELS